MLKTLITARDLTAPMNEVVPGHFVHQLRQRTWAGRASDEVITAWLRANNLGAGEVCVYRIAKGRSETFECREITA